MKKKCFFSSWISEKTLKNIFLKLFTNLPYESTILFFILSKRSREKTYILEKKTNFDVKYRKISSIKNKKKIEKLGSI